MLEKRFDETLGQLKVERSRVKAPASLRSGVWQRIAAAKGDQPRNMFERALAMIFTPRHHLVAVMTACVLGMISGTALTVFPGTERNGYFDVFSSHYTLSPTTLIRSPR